MGRRAYALLSIDAAPERSLAALSDGRGWEIVALDQADLSGLDAMTLVVSGTEVAALDVPLPARSDREARQAAPFAIEDDVASPLERLHIALGPRGDAAAVRRMVLACARERMDAWMGLLEVLGQPDARIICDSALMPSEPVFLDLGDRVLASRDGRRFAIDRALGADVVQAIAGDLPSLAGADDPFLALIGLDEAAPATDLRQGAYARAGSGLTLSLAGWRTAAGLAMVALAGWMVVGIVETQALTSKAAALRERAGALFAEIAPGDPVPNDLASALARLTVLEGDAGVEFLPALSALTRSISAEDGVELRSIRFDRRGGEFIANLAYPDYGVDERLRAAVERAGYAVRIGETRRGDGAVVGDLVIGGGA